MIKKVEKPMAVTINEAAVLLGISPALVRKAVKQKIIRSVRFGEKRILIPLKELEKILKWPDGTNFPENRT